MDWQARFGQVLGLKVVQLTGDDDTDGQEELESGDVICSTPEKFGECRSAGDDLVMFIVHPCSGIAGCNLPVHTLGPAPERLLLPVACCLPSRSNHQEGGRKGQHGLLC